MWVNEHGKVSKLGWYFIMFACLVVVMLTFTWTVAWLTD
jgi:hypothetical protein